MAGGRSLVSSRQDQGEKSERLKMEKNGLQYPKVGNKLQTITSEARHKQHNKLFEIFALISLSKNQTSECTVGRPLKELLLALKTEGLCQSPYLTQKDKRAPRCCALSFSAMEVGTAMRMRSVRQAQIQ